MTFKFKERRFIQYSLITVSFLVVTLLFLFFYNEYFNERKLTSIHNQIEQAETLDKMSKNALYHIIRAQNGLQNFIYTQDDNGLNEYFKALRDLTQDIDSIKLLINSYSQLNEIFDDSLHNDNLERAESLIDSLQKIRLTSLSQYTDFEIKEIEIKTQPSHFNFEIQHNIDSLVKKKFFHRILDAIKGTTDVRTDTVFIKTQYGIAFDTTKIKADFDSTIHQINQYYLNQIKEYKNFISKSSIRNQKLFSTYDNLIRTGNDLMNIYDGVISTYREQLQNQFDGQNSKVNNIRRFSVLGLIVALFSILILLFHYTRKAFQYENELITANERISDNLNFKNRILGMLSHEIRSPLKIINIFINKIKKSTDDEKVKGYLNSMSFTNNSLLIQANQILEYTKNQYSPLVMAPIEFNLKEEVDHITSVFSPFVEAAGNRLEIHNEVNPDIFVVADNSKIHQLFNNILGNANKFVTNGLIVVKAFSETKNDGFIRFLVSVEDNGVGISESDIKNIFQPYYRGIISSQVENIGAGLGLNLCKEIVEAFEGQIEIESTLGEGTVVSFSLDLKLKE